MSILIVVADGSRARFLQAETSNSPLIETSDFVHNASRQLEQDLTADGKGSGKDAMGYGRHTLGHENEAHKRQKETFARELSDEIDRVLKAGKTVKVYLLAGPSFLGLLRRFISKQALKLVMGEVEKDLVSHRIDVIRSHLPVTM